MSELILRNRQREWRIDLHFFRRVTLRAINEVFPDCDHTLGVHLIGPRAMARLNWDYLKHEGFTDVITFDHSESDGEDIYGEIYICVTVAVNQAREYGTQWTEELVRYMVHGLLHLKGYDDKTPVSRRIMKREENRIVRSLGSFYSLSDLDSGSKLKP